jgi:hypothetical protein
MLDSAGKLAYSVYLKAPGASFLAKLAVVAAAAAATGAGAAMAGPGGFYSIYTPNSAVFQKFKSSTSAKNYMYIFMEEAGTDPARFALVRLDKSTGKDTGRLKFTDRSPAFRLDRETGAVVVADGSTLVGLRFDFMGRAED